MTPRSRSVRPWLAIGLTVAAFLVATLCMAVAKKMGAIESLSAKRVALIAIGAVLIVAGNFVPKIRLLDPGRCEPGRALAAERFAGWCLVLGGASIVGMWLLVPSDRTVLVSSLVGLAAFALPVANWARLQLRGRRRPASRESVDRDAGVCAVGDAIETRAASAQRQALFYILFGLLWAFAIFFVDHFWGDRASRWMAVGFAMAVGIVPALRAVRSRTR